MEIVEIIIIRAEEVQALCLRIFLGGGGRGDRRIDLVEQQLLLRNDLGGIKPLDRKLNDLNPLLSNSRIDLKPFSDLAYANFKTFIKIETHIET